MNAITPATNWGKLGSVFFFSQTLDVTWWKSAQICDYQSYSLGETVFVRHQCSFTDDRKVGFECHSDAVTTTTVIVTKTDGILDAVKLPYPHTYMVFSQLENSLYGIFYTR